MRHAVVLSLAVAGTARSALDLGDLTVDPTRLPSVNARDGLPVDTSSWKVVTFGGEKTSQAVQAAIEAADPETVLVLPHGEYSGELTHRASQVVVRGDCADRSAVVWKHAGNPANGFGDWRARFGLCDPGWIQLCGPHKNDRRADVLQNPQRWSSGWARGTSVLGVADASGFGVGDMLWLESAPVGDPHESVVASAMTYIASVAAVGSGTLTLDRTLPIDFAQKNATVSRLGRMQRHAGVECLTLNHTNASDPSGLYLNFALTVRYSADSWIFNVDLGDTFNDLAQVNRASQVVIAQSRFGNQLKSRVGDGRTCNGKGPMAANPCWNKEALTYLSAHDNSFVNNVVESSIGLSFADTASRNWVAYNHFPKPGMHPYGEPRRTAFPHGKYGHDNLIEGNTFWGAMEMDTVWGSQGARLPQLERAERSPRITFFRNTALDALPTSPLPVSLQFATEAWATAPNPFWLGRNASYLLNYGRQYTGAAGQDPIDTRSAGMWFERNVFTDRLITGSPTAVGTVARDNYNASRTPLGHAWDGLRLPSSLNPRLGGNPPAFWCANTVSNGGRVCDFDVQSNSVGAFWDNSCVLPAQQIAEGGECN